jgi:hypothetical protein
MGDRLDAAARISARTMRAAARTPVAQQLRENVSFFRRVARAAAAEAISSPPTPQPRPAVEPLPTPPHPGLTRQPEADYEPGDHERCSCRSPEWCGATKGDVVHDLMTRGMHLDRAQAESIWRDAQDRRAV